MSKAMRKVTGSLAKSTCTVVFLNQLRSKIGTVNFYLYILILSPPSLFSCLKKNGLGVP